MWVRRGVRMLSGLLVTVALALMVSALGVGAGGWPWEAQPRSADGYPQRIERPYVVRDLPAKPGAVAGLVSDGLSWFAVSAHGRLWRLDDNADDVQVPPALSPDGRRLAYLRDTGGGSNEYVVRDLVSGELTAFPQLGNGPDDQTFFIGPQHPTYVSPDGDRVLVQGSRVEGRDADGLVVTDRGVREVFIQGTAWPVGWSPEGRLVWLVTPSYDEQTSSPALVATDIAGRETGRLELHLKRPATFHQWSAVLAPDASAVSLVPDAESGPLELLVFSVPDGKEVERHPFPDLGWCHPTWRGAQLLTPAPDHALADLDGDAVVVVDPSIDAECSIWATDAVAGDRHRGLTGSVFGTGTSWLSWRWREAAAGLLLLLAASGFLLAGRSRREEAAAVSG